MPSGAGPPSIRLCSSSCSSSCSSRGFARNENSSRPPASTSPIAGTCLTRIRQRLGIDIFQRFFEQVVDLCQEAGLVWGRELYFDATKVEANAGTPSLIPRFHYEAKTHVADRFANELGEEGEQPAPVENNLPAGIVRLPIAANAEGMPTAADPPWRLLEERRLDPH